MGPMGLGTAEQNFKRVEDSQWQDRALHPLTSSVATLPIPVSLSGGQWTFTLKYVHCATCPAELSAIYDIH